MLVDTVEFIFGLGMILLGVFVIGSFLYWLIPDVWQNDVNIHHERKRDKKLRKENRELDKKNKEKN